MQAPTSEWRAAGSGRRLLYQPGKALLAAIWENLPQGMGLPEDIWRRRHAGILILLWLHVFAITLVAVLSGHTFVHGLVESSAVASFALLAGWQSGHRRRAAALASLGLLTSSAILVHLTEGNIETHFHFFVMISVVTLYEDWVPFLLAIGLVLFHHGGMGALDPSSVYNHRDAVLHPWKWAAIHGAFVLGASMACVINWRLAEGLRAREQHARTETEALLSATAQLGAQAEPEAVLRALVEQATALLEASRASYGTRVEGDSVVVTARWDREAWAENSIHVPIEGSIIGRVWRKGIPYASNDLATDPYSNHALDRTSQVQSQLSVPLLGPDGERLGVVSVFNSRRRDGFSPRDERLLAAFCGQASAILLRAQGTAARLAAEAEVRSLNEDLEQRVRERTAQLEQANRELAEHQQKLEETQEYLDTLLVASPVVMFRGTSENADLTYVSPNFSRILGYTPEEIEEEPHFWLDRMHPDDRTAAEVAMRAATQPGSGHVEQEFRILHKDGTYRWVHLIIRFEADEQRNWQSFLGYLLDITERQQAREALQEAKTEAERANQAKNEFLSRMSHELRTPLNAILGFAELMDLDDRNDEDREALQLILAAGRHLLELINEVLDIARIEAGQLALSPEPVAVRQTLREVIALTQPLAAERSIEIDFPDAPCNRHVMADHQRLKQVLLNLLSNAIKYNRTGGRVTVTYEERRGRQLRMVVTDTGIGIPERLLDRLFSPFDRLGADQTGVDGTGLGLALSKRLIEAMQGGIGAESTQGQGSAFWIELPLVDSADEELDPLALQADGSSAGTSAGARVVLYVEDNLSNFKLIQRMLARRPQISLLPAMQGGLGLDLAREHQPDLILLDVHLPDIAGDEVLRRLQSDPRTRAIPVIMISADATSHQRERTLTAGARAYLTKPLQVGRFLETLDATLEEKVIAR